MIGGICLSRLPLPPEFICNAVWLHRRFTHTIPDDDDLLSERGVTVSYEAIRLWCREFSPILARDLCCRESQLGDFWYVNEAFIAVHWVCRNFWRAAG